MVELDKLSEKANRYVFVRKEETGSLKTFKLKIDVIRKGYRYRSHFKVAPKLPRGANSIAIEKYKRQTINEKIHQALFGKSNYELGNFEYVKRLKSNGNWRFQRCVKRLPHLPGSGLAQVEIQNNVNIQGTYYRYSRPKKAIVVPSYLQTMTDFEKILISSL